MLTFRGVDGDVGFKFRLDIGLIDVDRWCCNDRLGFLRHFRLLIDGHCFAPLILAREPIFLQYAQEYLQEPFFRSRQNGQNGRLGEPGAFLTITLKQA